MLAKLNQLWISSRSRRIFQILVGILCLLLVVEMHHIPVVAQQITQATIIEVLDSDQVFIQNAKARKNAVAKTGQQVRTVQARAGLRFNNNAAIRLGRSSSLLVGSQCVRLNRGQVVISGGARGCIGSVVAVTRGTIYTLEADGADQGEIKVLEGQVEVSNLDDPEVKSVVVSQGQKVAVSLGKIIGDIVEITQAELAALLTGGLFEGFQEPLPNQANLPQVLRNQGFASNFLRDALTGSDTRFEGQKGKASVVIINPNSVDGTFTRMDNNSAKFDPDDPILPDVTIGVDFDKQQISINGTSGVMNAVGLSGNNASGSVILSDGQIIRIEVFDVGLDEPVINRVPAYRGRLTNGIAPDR